MSYTGGQCDALYRFEGGEATIVKLSSTGVEQETCYVEYAPGITFRGPITRVLPEVGQTWGSVNPPTQAPMLGIFTVQNGGASLNYLPSSVQPPVPNDTRRFKCTVANFRFTRLDENGQPGLPDNCGNVPLLPQDNPCNPAPGQGACPAIFPSNSEFEAHSGAVTESIDLVTYQSLWQRRGLTLRYSSLSADPRPILHFRYSQVYNINQTLIAKLTVRRGEFTYRVPGYPRQEYGLTERENFWSVPLSYDPFSSYDYSYGILDAALQADLRDQPSGQYEYTLRRSIQYIDPDAPQFSALDPAETGTFIHLNRVESPFGAGWALAGWQELIENPDGSLLLLDGDGTQLLFDPPTATGNPYRSPVGDFSRLEKLANNTYRRTLTDQTVYSFNASGKLRSITERNGNQTQYIYNASGRLIQIIDPVNLTTTLTYAGGRVTQIVDPAERITTLDYDPVTGDLVKLTHPDNAIWQWEYQEHRMTASIDPRSNRAEFRYDFAGRALEATRRDGTIVKIEPVAVRGLAPADQTNTFINPPPAYRWPDAQANSPSATYTDGNEHKLFAQVDRRGNPVVLTDEVGQIQRIQYNAQNLVAVQTNGRGQPTNYDYDSFDNVRQVSDTLTDPSSGSYPRTYTYDPTFNQLTSVTDELGHWTLYDIDPANGNVRSVTQVVGSAGGTDDQTTSYTYYPPRTGGYPHRCPGSREQVQLRRFR